MYLFSIGFDASNFVRVNANKNTKERVLDPHGFLNPKIEWGSGDGGVSLS
jgi:hypothetical protein